MGGRDLRPYEPSVEMPDEGGASGRLTGASIPARAAQPSLVTDPHLLKTVSKESVDATADGAQCTFRF